MSGTCFIGLDTVTRNGQTPTIQYNQFQMTRVGTKINKARVVSVLTVIAAIIAIGLKLSSKMQSSALFSSVRLPSPPVKVKALYTANPSSVEDRNNMAASPKWAQKTVTLPPLRRGCHLITPKVTSLLLLTHSKP